MSKQLIQDETDPVAATGNNGDEHSNDLIEEKGKGKSAEPNTEDASQDISMDDADDSSEDEAKEASDVAVDELEEEEEEDNLEEIDTSNIIAGSRTRGRTIDFAKAAENMDIEDDDDEEDDDFETAEGEEMKE